MEYNSSDKVLTITRNPHGFINKPTDIDHYGIKLNESGYINDKDFIKLVINKIEGDKNNDIKVNLLKNESDGDEKTTNMFQLKLFQIL